MSLPKTSWPEFFLAAPRPSEGSDGHRAARKYIFSEMARVKGYLNPVDGLAISALLLGQEATGFTGSVAEVGVFYGRSFFLMKRMVGPQDKVFAADLFDIGQRQDGPSDQLRDFLRNAGRFGLKIEPAALYAGDSGALSAKEIFDSVGNCRLFHIDGGHEWEHVQKDAELALSAIADYGVIVFDDFFNSRWPDVSLATIDFIRTNSELRAFAITDKKLYVCRSGFADKYSNMITRSALLDKVTKTKVNLFGNSLMFFHEKMSRRILFELASRLGVSRAAQILY